MRQSLSKQRLVPCACDRQRVTQRSLLNTILCLLALGLPHPLLAIDPHQPMSQMEHSAWSARDGLDGEVSALAQTTDGYLWLGCATGLYRFDGEQFQRYKPIAGALPSNQVQTLLATPDGGLWVGFAHSGVAFVKGGQVMAYRSPAQFPVGFVRKLVRSPDGYIWAAVTGGFVRFVRGKWEVIGKAWKYSGNSPDTLFVDHLGTLWAATGQKFQFLLAGQHEFQDTGVSASLVPAIIEAPDGSVWGVDGKTGELDELRAPVQGDTAPRHLNGVSSSMLLFDRDGSLWIAASFDGVRRAAYPAQIPAHNSVQSDVPAIELFTPHQGLSGHPSEQVLEDREGNIWVGTADGLDRFRRRNLTWKPMPPDTLSSTLFRGVGSDVWASLTADSKVTPSLIRLQDGAIAHGAPTTILKSYSDPHGIVWLSQKDAFWRWQKGQFSSVDLPLHLKKFVQSATLDAAGHLWIALAGYGEFRRDGEKWTFLRPLPEQPDLTANSSYADARGDVWIVYTNSIVAMRGDSIRRDDSSQDKAIAPYNVVTGDGQHIWIGGEHGIAFFDGSHFVPITTADGSPLEAITSVVDSASSGLWLSSSGKLVHVPEEEVKRVYGGGRSVHIETYDLISDLPEPVLRGIEGADGIIWFATPSFIVRVDPAELTKNLLPPIVSIESLTADKHSYSTNNGVRLPPLTRNIEIGYAALSLTIPERVRSRYRLDNWDKDWQDGGLRRQVSYTNLPPGHYRFHVIAANNDGLWNDIGQSLDFDIRPAYYQTVWFLCLSIAAGLLVLWLIYAMRLRSATNQVQARMIARLDERERIARELHDTFLQGLYALLLRFQTISDAVPEDTPARKMMEDALNRADTVLLQGRESLRGLRGDPSLTMSVAEELEHLAHECRQDSEAAFTLSITGQERALHPVIRDETIQIGKEAIFNSFRHSGAASVRVQLCYDRAFFSLTVADDGCGIDPDVLAKGGKAGHWGMLGMRERSRKIGAHFTVSARHKGGTEVRLRVPSNLAYSKRAIFRSWSTKGLFKKFSRKFESEESN
jgi:signal transduction histidine kinase/ligand-binding sensor domain-containing protein